VIEVIDWASVDKVELGAAVTLSGLAFVFAALVILILSVVLMGKLMGTKPKQKTPEPPAGAPKTQAPAPPANPPAFAVQSDIEEETVAVLSSAVAYAMQQTAPGIAYAVTNIRRSTEARPVWGFAGMQQSTRPF